MEFHSVVFFCKDKKFPKTTTDISKATSYPASLRFSIRSELELSGEGIDIYLSSIQDLINFKNSFLSSYEKAMKGAGYDK